MNKLLQLRHWQLFLLLFGIPLVMEVLFILTAVAAKNIQLLMFFFPLLMIFSVGILFGWLYALGVNLYKKLPVTVSMNLMRFKIFLLIPAVYILFICIFMFSVFKITTPIEPLSIGAAIVVIIPVHLFSMFCIFYCLYFNAKILKAVESQKPVAFNDYVGEFFLMWFFPIGIWIIQPRINKIFAKNK